MLKLPQVKHHITFFTKAISIALVLCNQLQFEFFLKQHKQNIAWHFLLSNCCMVKFVFAM